VRKITLSLASHASKGSLTDKIPMTVGGIFGRHDICGKIKGGPEMYGSRTSDGLVILAKF
jgi:hypothetical protein